MTKVPGRTGGEMIDWNHSGNRRSFSASGGSAFLPSFVRPKEDMMELNSREVWTVLHGLVLGTVFLLAFAGGLAGLWSLRPGLLTTAGIRERMTRLNVGV